MCAASLWKFCLLQSWNQIKAEYVRTSRLVERIESDLIRAAYLFQKAIVTTRGGRWGRL